MSGWRETTLGEACELYQPKTISSADLVADGKYPVYGANGVIGNYDKFNHAEPQLLVTCRGATCGSVNMSLPNAWINGNAMVSILPEPTHFFMTLSNQGCIPVRFPIHAALWLQSDLTRYR